VALAWARDWTLFRGEMPDQELVAEFESLYDEQERRDILATVVAMDFANRFMNTTTGDVLVPPTEDKEAGEIRKPAWSLGGKNTSP
jgi:hypothetical protein